MDDLPKQPVSYTTKPGAKTTVTNRLGKPIQVVVRGGTTKMEVRVDLAIGGQVEIVAGTESIDIHYNVDHDYSGPTLVQSGEAP
jgi:hypothetical protein